MVKNILNTNTNTMVKLGRNRSKFPGPKLSLGNYLLKSLPSAPDHVDYSAPAAESLSRIYMNNALGCCVISGGAHVRGVTSGNNGGTPVLFSDDDIVKMYGVVGGYVPHEPSTDNGCNEQDALNYWSKVGFTDGLKLSGWASVNALDINECKTALWLFENLYFGLELPDSWITPFPSANGFTWDASGPPDPSNGHCVMGAGYNADGVLIDTWGMLGVMTWKAIQKYCVQSSNGELYVLFSPDVVNNVSKKAPNGFDWTQLSADLQAMGGTVINVPPVVGPSDFLLKVTSVFDAIKAEHIRNKLLVNTYFNTTESFMTQYIKDHSL